MHKSLLSASLFALALAAPLAHAHQASDIIVRAGAITTAPNEDSGELKLDGAKISGTKATLTSDTQLGLTFAYMLTDHIGLELLAATPSSTKSASKALARRWTVSLATSSNCHQPCRCSTTRWTLRPDSSRMPVSVSTTRCSLAKT